MAQTSTWTSFEFRVSKINLSIKAHAKSRTHVGSDRETKFMLFLTNYAVLSYI